MLKTIAPAFVAVAALTIATPAAAETVSVEVKYADLDLSKEAGRETLQGRIAQATREVCGPRAEVRNIHDSADREACMRQVKAQVTIEIARVTGEETLLASLDQDLIKN